MKITRLYSNQADKFPPIEFHDGLSVVLAEIREPANRLLDTHNLGKTTIAELIDFCLLKGKSSSFFLYKHLPRFREFAFYLEFLLPSGEFLTIGRRVVPGPRVDFKKSPTPIADASILATSEWDHHNVPSERARKLLNGLLAIDVLKPWDYRKFVGYLIRSQHDYRDVFQLAKFSGRHSDWKPFVAHLLGMKSGPAIGLYQTRESLEVAAQDLETLTREWSGDDVDPSVLDGLISVKRRAIDEKTKVLNSFNFAEEDSRITGAVVDEIESRIAGLNDELYRNSRIIKQIRDSLAEDEIRFGPDAAAALFKEAGVQFSGQLKRDYDQLIAFNRAITEERRQALSSQISSNENRQDAIRRELLELNRQRAQSLEFIRNSDSLSKFKDVSRDLTTLQSDLGVLESKRAAVARLLELRRQHRVLLEQYGHFETTVETEIDEISQSEEGRFGRLRRYFTEIISEVLGQDAIIAIRMNSKGGLEFTAEFIGSSGTATSGDKGTSYRKLLCIAFDLALLRTYMDVPFPRFVYHDGALEQLEPRKREKLIGVFRAYAAMGLQPIISCLDSDLPAPLGSSSRTIAPNDVVLKLHDQGESGRLFKMPSW